MQHGDLVARGGLSQRVRRIPRIEEEKNPPRCGPFEDCAKELGRSSIKPLNIFDNYENATFVRYGIQQIENGRPQVQVHRCRVLRRGWKFLGRSVELSK